MKINNQIIEDFSKKIYGFAYDKTRDHYKAEELSQEIILTLIKCSKDEDIANINGYVYTVCCYSWSNFLRKTIRDRRSVSIENMSLQSDCDPMLDTEKSMMAERLRREVSRLAGTGREITVMHYYDNIPCGEIAEKLGLKSATVRWYLGESRKKLKEAVNMNENLNFAPVKMWCGHNGESFDFKMHGLSDNILVQNIAYACYGKSLTVEEISRMLNVGAAYLEYYIDDLVYMDYLKKTGSKYQTNFVIETVRDKYERVKYAYENFGGTAAEIAEQIKERMNDITDIGFTGCDADKDSLTETFLADTLNYILWSELDGIRKKDGVYELLTPPCRKDGSKHWVCAGLRGELPNDGDKKVIDMMKSVPGFNGSKERSTADGIISRQFDFGDWRDFNGEELSMLSRIRDIILKTESPSSYSSHDKMIIAKMAKEGYITVENNVPRLLVPFMNAEEYERYSDIREDICKSRRSEVNGYLTGFIKMMNGLIPDFLDKAVRTEKAYDAVVNTLTCAVAYVYSKGMIRRPDNTVNKGSYTLIWTENK